MDDVRYRSATTAPVTYDEEYAMCFTPVRREDLESMKQKADEFSIRVSSLKFAHGTKWYFHCPECNYGYEHVDSAIGCCRDLELEARREYARRKSYRYKVSQQG